MKILRMTHKKKCLCASESESTPEVVQNVALDLLPSLLKNPPAFHKPPATNPPPLLPRPLHSHFLPMTARFISPHSCAGLAAQGRHCPPPRSHLSLLPAYLLLRQRSISNTEWESSPAGIHRSAFTGEDAGKDGGPGRRSGISLGF